MSRYTNFRGFSPADRIKEWCRLLGVSEDNNEAIFWGISSEKRAPSEIRVIEQDVIRTRQDEDFFRLLPTINIMKSALISYCSYYNCEYMQGLNEIIAVIMCIDNITSHSQDTITKSNICFPIFEKFVGKLMPVIFSTKGVQALQIQLCHFNLLFYYHAPELCYLLEDEGMSIDIYATAWFVTLFSRRTPTPVTLHLWDLLIQCDRPHMILFVAVAFVMWNEELLRHIDKELLPETLVRLSFQTTTDVDDVFALSLRLEATTPLSVTAMAGRLGFDATLPQGVRTEALVTLQQQRLDCPCVSVSADDVAAALLGVSYNRQTLTPTGTGIGTGFGSGKYVPAEQPSVVTSQPSTVAETKETETTEATMSTTSLMLNSSSSSSSISTFPRMRYLLLDLRELHSRRVFIEGSVSIPPDIARELIRTTNTILLRQQHHQHQHRVDVHISTSSNTTSTSTAIEGGAVPPTLLEAVVTSLSADAASALGLLWSCIGPDVHFAVLLEDRPIFDSHSHILHSKDPVTAPDVSTQSQSQSSHIPPGTVSMSMSVAVPAVALLGNAFAHTLIRLGFPRISVVGGEGLPSVPSALPVPLKDIRQGLASSRDGTAALAFRLWMRGTPVSPLGVLQVPEDAVLIHRARRFASASQQTSVHSTRRVGGKAGLPLMDNSGGGGTLSLAALRQYVGSEGMDFLTRGSDGIMETLQGLTRTASSQRSILSEFIGEGGGLKETVTVSGTGSSDEVVRRDVPSLLILVRQLRMLSRGQSVESGKHLLRTVQVSTASLVTVADSMGVLRQRCVALRGRVEGSSGRLTRTLQSLKSKLN
eukprot:gene6453-13036_t